MKFSEQWLRTWVNPPVDTETLCEQLTNLGLEIDGHESTFGQLNGVSVAEIKAIEAVPGSDNKSLRLCHVDAGSGIASVVCGAPNVKVGMKVAYAAPGASVDDTIVEETRMHGIVSKGLLCSGGELGISADTSGVLELDKNATIGEDIRQVLQLDDVTIDIDLTPNRGDCLSIRGVARETALINQLSVEEPKITPIEAQCDQELPIHCENSTGCPRYLGRVIADVDSAAMTPDWMVRRLEGCGLRTIDPIVDVTNYVMLALGQPLHAFDLRNVANGIVVRDAEKGEKLKLLDGTEIEFEPETLLITDGETPLAIAGVMGGERSGIRDDTSDVFLECAFFSPDSIIGTPRVYGLQTDASMRYERGVDPELQEQAMEFATDLLVQIVGGKPGPVSRFEAPAYLPEQRSIELRKSRLTALIGEHVADEDVEQIFQRLSFDVTTNQDHWMVGIPSFRFDLAIEEDLVEEVCRVHGYNEIGASHPRSSLAFDVDLARTAESAAQRNRVAELGYFEVINYSFIEKEVNDRFVPAHHAPQVENPIASQFESMRKTLIPGLISSARYNLARQQSSVRLFEYGKCFGIYEDEINQHDLIAGIAIGNDHPENWNQPTRATDFFDLKGDVESILTLLSGEISFERTSQSFLHPGQAARVRYEDRVVGVFGKLHPEFTMDMELPEDTYVFELNAEPFKRLAVSTAEYVAPFPYVRRDLALLMNRDIEVQDLCAAIKGHLRELLIDLVVFDVYEGENIDADKKSVGLGLTLQDRQKTLTDEIVSERMGSLLLHLKESLDVSLR